MVYADKAGFQFKGTRTYVQGPDIVWSVVQFGRQVLGQYPDEITGSFHALLRKQGHIRLFHESPPASPPPSIASTTSILSIASIAPAEAPVAPVARFQLSVAGEKYIAEVLSTDEEIRASRPYDEDDLLRDCVLGEKSIRMKSREEYTYIEQIVALTKRLHHKAYPAARGKWLFTKIQLGGYLDPASYVGRTVEVKAVKNFQNRLSQCEILVEGCHAGSIYFTAFEEGPHS